MRTDPARDWTAVYAAFDSYAELAAVHRLLTRLPVLPRLASADEVWLAVRATRRGRDRDRRARALCRLLGFGLLAAHLPGGEVEVLAEPEPYRPRANLRRRRALPAPRRR